MPRVDYLGNTTLLICHEIDSAYWREGELFHTRRPNRFRGVTSANGVIRLYGMMLTARGGLLERSEVFIPAQFLLHRAMLSAAESAPLVRLDYWNVT